jgi:glycosyltransferase involved in cell wall biosynthesis
MDVDNPSAISRTEMDKWVDEGTVTYLGYNDDVISEIKKSHCVVLPSYREGFPNAPLEAAAMGLPVVASDAVGCIDAVQDGETGVIFPAGDTDALRIAVKQYLDDPSLRRKHGAKGRLRVLKNFRPEDVWGALLAEYNSLCKR